MEEPDISVPGQDVVQFLSDKYYKGESDTGGLEFASSDWKRETQRFSVRNAPGGEIVPLSESYWGCHWSSIGTRILDQLCIASYLAGLPNRRRVFSYMGKAAEVCRQNGLNPTYTVFRQTCSLELIARHMSDDLRSKRIFALIIGDGIGVLSALIKFVFPNSTIVVVDLGKTLLYQAYYIRKAHPGVSHRLAVDVDELDNLDFVYCPAERLDAIDIFKFDLAANINSMQEMDPATVARYFTFLRSHLNPDNLFYCCNRLHREMVGGEKSEFLNYPWQPQDRHIVDEPCPWQRYFLASSAAARGPKILNQRVPFVSYFDGPVHHRLSALATD